MKKQAATLMTAAILTSAFSGIASADTYTVKKGDTLSHIAFTYKTTVVDLKKTNKLSSDLIYVNQTLTVPGTTAVAKPVVAPAKPAATAETASVYIVVSGDTLSKIASQHKIALSDLMKWNNLSGYLIYPGQKLKISNGTAAVTPAPVKTQPTAPAQPAKEPAKSEGAEYIIKSGDTLSGIGKQFGMTVQELKKLNNLKSDMIFVGQKLLVSMKGETAPSSPAPVQPPAKQPVPSADSEVLAIAQDLLGVPYSWGGSTPEGFDCSGFIYYAFNKAGMKMGRYSSEGYYNRAYYINDPQPGDLVFFENTYKPGISHMGIYLGNNEFIHASDNGVIISNLDNPYYKNHFDGFKRFY
ncbi:LysM peptidoglycan-binding domain-containing protein [Mesobacillus subterraneus]|uniref:C40 family peptidase n=1 Tax=Mesobacillus subterraneus TaxID=285983 RepID=UPI00203CFF1A|nr:LysM peptidoglycan-binding domain-containing protein [Mesobacillus subterraneus]MCM3664706.1 LysM peptidoglycan-binding domain-containing protein [Mesobacillus subterraneus]MCM3683780.1 LysM peptidoglycan-binding domain-containing protein [Mesobacillus subterraneus]